MPKTAAVYLRQSLDRLGDELAVTRQREDCLALCERNGWEPIEYLDNDISASKRNVVRPSYERMIADYEAGLFDVIVCWDLDRLTRQPKQLEDWIDRAEQRGLKLVTASGEADLSTDNGRLFARIKAAVVRGEVERKSYRQTRSAEQRAELGRPWWSHRPFGLERDGSLRQDEAEALRNVYHDLLAGVSLRRCVEYLNEAGLYTNGTKRGEKGSHPKPWTTQSLGQLVRNPRNAGIRAYRGEEVGKGNWDPVVEEDVYRAVLRMMKAPERRTALGKGGIGNRLNLLTGLAECGKCGGSISTATRTSKAYGEFKAYCCRGKRCVTTDQDWVDSIVIREAIARVDQWQIMLPQGSTDELDVAALQAEEAALAVRRTEFAEDRALGLIDRKAMIDGINLIDARTAEITRLLADNAQKAHGFNIFDTEALWEWTSNEDGELDVNKVRAVLDRVVEKVVLYPRGKGHIALVREKHIRIYFVGEEREQAS